MMAPYADEIVEDIKLLFNRWKPTARELDIWRARLTSFDYTAAKRATDSYFAQKQKGRPRLCEFLELLKKAAAPEPVPACPKNQMALTATEINEHKLRAYQRTLESGSWPERLFLATASAIYRKMDVEAANAIATGETREPAACSAQAPRGLKNSAQSPLGLGNEKGNL
jgi:hypothetical protein